VQLWSHNAPTSKEVHVLVAEVFLGPRPNGAEINHKNGIKADNHYRNLEYTTQAENFQHALDTGLLRRLKDGTLQGHIHG
jgi:hypothetical protein